MAFTWDDEQKAEIERCERNWEREQEERDAKEAADAIDYDALAGFIQTPYCSQACCDALAHTAGCNAAPAIAEPVAAALDGWLKAVTIAPRGYATIMPGIAVRVGKRRAA